MQKLYIDTRKLDVACRASYGLTEEIMMENAAAALEKEIRNPSVLKKEKNAFQKILILCGSGNNGADGYTLARRLRFDYDISVIQFSEPKSDLCVLQSERAEKCGVRFVKKEDLSFYDLRFTDVIVDCVFGSGFHDDFDEKVFMTFCDMNECDCYKIACDVPSGLREDGSVAEGAFKADLTVTMGALKLCLYSDIAKDFTGSVVCGDLGVNRRLFENSSAEVFQNVNLLDETDLELPYRGKKNVNKGTFGHAVIAYGEKCGAGIIAAKSAFCFGAGLVSLVDLTSNKPDFSKVPAEIMSSDSIPENISAFAFGMGLGREQDKLIDYFEFAKENPELPCVIDADACYYENLKDFLEKRDGKTVLTPHPKEFQAILKNVGIGEYKLSECKLKRPELIEKFCKMFPKTVLLVKGANTYIGIYDGFKFQLFVNPLGSPALAKGGSGDVLSGLVVSMLAQGYKPTESAITADLAHGIASTKVKNNFALTPDELINQVTLL